MYLVFLCATVVGDATREVCETGGTPTLQVFLLPAMNTGHPL